MCERLSLSEATPRSSVTLLSERGHPSRTESGERSEWPVDSLDPGCQKYMQAQILLCAEKDISSCGTYWNLELTGGVQF
jgi:hypothetical protein